MPLRRLLLPALLGMLAGTLVAGAAAQDSHKPQSAKPPSVKPAQVERAYRLALQSNVEYCQQWFDEGDFKSLASTADVVRVISQLAAGKSRRADWIKSCKQLALQAGSLTKLARGAEKDAKRKAEVPAAIKKLRQEMARLKRQKSDSTAAGNPEKRATAAKRVSAGVGQWMAVLDATYTDAKAAITFDEPQQAKDLAIVLADVAEQLSQVRRQKAWIEDCRGVARRARETAREESKDPKQLRSRFKAIYKNCASCHDRR